MSNRGAKKLEWSVWRNVMEPLGDTRARKPIRRGAAWRGMLSWSFWLMLALVALCQLPFEVGYWQLALAEKASQEGRTEEALAWIAQAKEWLPENPLPFQVQAIVLSKGGKTDPLAAIEAILKQNPPNKIKVPLHLKASAIYKQKGQYEESLRE